MAADHRQAKAAVSNQSPDVNLIFQSLIDTARTLYKGMSAGETRNVSVSRSLLERGDPEPQRFDPLTRLIDWSDKLGFPVSFQNPEGQPAIVTVTIRRHQ